MISQINITFTELKKFKRLISLLLFYSYCYWCCCVEAKKELERIIEEERLAEEERLENIVAEEIEIKEEAMQDEGVEEFNINNFNELPKEIKVITRLYKVNGTPEQIEAIENIMNAVSVEWEVL